MFTCVSISCRLGETLLSEGLDITPVPRFGVGSGPILLDDVSCTGKEPSLFLCNRREWLHHDCTHHEDVNIACSPEHNGESISTSKTKSYHTVTKFKDYRWMGENSPLSRVYFKLWISWQPIRCSNAYSCPATPSPWLQKTNMVSYHSSTWSRRLVCYNNTPGNVHVGVFEVWSGRARACVCNL